FAWAGPSGERDGLIVCGAVEPRLPAWPAQRRPDWEQPPYPSPEGGDRPDPSVRRALTCRRAFLTDTEGPYRRSVIAGRRPWGKLGARGAGRVGLRSQGPQR